MAIYAIKRKDGGISVMNTEPEIVDEMIIKSGFEGCEYFSIEEGVLPNDRFFRDAWVIENNNVVINPEKKLNIIRQKRKVILEQLDKEELAETFNPKGDVTPIREKKQILRDITKSDLSDEEIKNLLKTR